MLVVQPRLKPLARFGVAALLLHAAVLGGLEWTWPKHTAAAAPALPMQVRIVAPQPQRPVPGAFEAATAPAATEPAATEPAVSRPVEVRRRSAAARPPELRLAVAVARVAPLAPPSAAVQLVSQALPASPQQVSQVSQVSQGSPDPPPAVVTATRQEPAAAPDEPIPHYRTQLPPAALLRYELQRGGLRGSGDLLWRPDGDHYELRLDGRVGPLTVLTQVSSGGFDAAGLAPLRFTDKRLRRPTLAANFQREAGKITFSGPATEYALQAGTQDRLSWMLQLAAIVAADPALRNPGAKVLMGVVGAQAELSVWAFRCVGPEAVDTGAGSVDSIRYARDPRDPYDTTVQVWLDPLQHFLPVHATQKSGPNDAGFSLRLQEIAAPP